MGSVQTFEVRVEVKRKGSRHFSSHVGKYIEEGIVKMFHIDARTPDQAWEKAKKRGHPVSCRKVDAEKIMDRTILIEPLNPYPNAVAMDEMIWKKKTKRAERLEDRKKDVFEA